MATIFLVPRSRFCGSSCWLLQSGSHWAAGRNLYLTFPVALMLKTMNNSQFRIVVFYYMLLCTTCQARVSHFPKWRTYSIPFVLTGSWFVHIVTNTRLFGPFVATSVPGSDKWARLRLVWTVHASVAAQLAWRLWLASVCESGTTLWAWCMKVALRHQSIAWIMHAQERVKAMLCIICRLWSKVTFGQPFAGFRKALGLI